MVIVAFRLTTIFNLTFLWLNVNILCSLQRCRKLTVFKIIQYITELPTEKRPLLQIRQLEILMDGTTASGKRTSMKNTFVLSWDTLLKKDGATAN